MCLGACHLRRIRIGHINHRPLTLTLAIQRAKPIACWAVMHHLAQYWTLQTVIVRDGCHPRMHHMNRMYRANHRPPTSDEREGSLGLQTPLHLLETSDYQSALEDSALRETMEQMRWAV